MPQCTPETSRCRTAEDRGDGVQTGTDLFGNFWVRYHPPCQHFSCMDANCLQKEAVSELLSSHDELRAGLRVALTLIRRMRRVRNVDAKPTLERLCRLIMAAKGVAEDARTRF